jgi:hypothetical protein
MGSLSNSRIPAVDIGTHVLLRVLDLDRGRLAPRIVLAFLDVNSSGLICWAPRKAYLNGCTLEMNSQLLETTSRRHMMYLQVHHLFGQPQ